MSDRRGRTRPGDLFPDALPDLAEGLARMPELLRRILPLKEKHRKVLAGGVRRLSAFLTVERDKLPSDYMTRPEYLAAYLHYFLPWNIYRQGRLLQGLDFSLSPDSTILDFGSGPLTFLQALWLARPHMRRNHYTYVGFDRSESGLKAGRKLFEGLGGPEGQKWTVRTERQLGAARKSGPADLIVAANFINELSPPRSGPGQDFAAEDALLQRWDSLLKPDAAILVIEPGTRSSARQLFRLRQSALATGWVAAAPCPQQGECAMPGIRSGSWCHFNFTPSDIPEWLFKFSRKVKLPKDRASLSFLLLTRGQNCPVKIATAPRPKTGEGLVRVISETFDLPDQKQGRYGCSGKGLVLLENMKTQHSGPQPGDQLTITWPASPRKDAKSKALIIPATEEKPEVSDG
jgi:ribosomal protein RSM22 (predicted rRNA methylase)